ncbi:MAG: FecR family protein, partial [Myxococcota bacterium]
MSQPTPCQATAQFIQSHPAQAHALPAPFDEHARSCATCHAIAEQAAQLHAMVDAASHPEPAEPRGRNPLLVGIPVAVLAAGLGIFVGIKLAQHSASDAPTPATNAPAAQTANRIAAPHHAPDATAPKVTALSATSCTLTAAGKSPAPCGLGPVLETQPGERMEVALSDGSTLRVNHSSRVILRDDAPRAVRVESGEALLEAAHREDLPALRLDL